MVRVREWVRREVVSKRVGEGVGEVVSKRVSERRDKMQMRGEAVEILRV